MEFLAHELEKVLQYLNDKPAGAALWEIPLYTKLCKLVFTSPHFSRMHMVMLASALSISNAPTEHED